MEVTRVMSLPLSREPELFLGLTLRDVIWVALGTGCDVLVWHAAGQRLRLVLVVMVSLAAASLAWLRWEDRSLPGWLWLIVRFYTSHRLFLP